MEDKVRHVVMNMLKVRGYVVPDAISDFMQDEEYLTHKINDQEDKLYIFSPKIPKVGVSTIRKYVGEMEANIVKKAIIIVKESITPFAKQEVKDVHIECFKEDELFIDKLQHVSVPEHRLLVPEEKKQILEHYMCKETQLPKIRRDDPISRYFGAECGQVFEITRQSETGGLYKNYRIVI